MYLLLKSVWCLAAGRSRLTGVPFLFGSVSLYHTMEIDCPILRTAVLLYSIAKVYILSMRQRMLSPCVLCMPLNCLQLSLPLALQPGRLAIRRKLDLAARPLGPNHSLLLATCFLPKTPRSGAVIKFMDKFGLPSTAWFLQRASRGRLGSDKACSGMFGYGWKSIAG
ncbi:hypothetical protein F5Y17DRAFT_67805 [Xylariaceae sp. FL0594]|nr:hypothetical protein F5Y17DRAFT_67805 [Xylariaceae sp. FL0594]